MQSKDEKQSDFKRVSENLFRVPNGRYYALVKVGGKQIKKSLRTTDRKLAERRLKDFLGKASSINPSAEQKNIHFAELAKLWLASVKTSLKPKSHERRAVAVKSLTPYFAGKPIRNLGLVHIEAWASRRANEISARTWNMEVETLRMIFEYAQSELRIILENPADKAKRRKQAKKIIRVPTREEFGKLVNALRNGHRSTGEAANLVEFLAYSGCRVGEARNVRWSDVTEKTIIITGGALGTKNHEQRVVPIFPALRSLLERLRTKQTAPDDLLFSIKRVDPQIRRACARLGIPHWTPHSFRHFFMTNAVEEEIPSHAVAAWVGHKDGGVLVAKTYGHLRPGFSELMAERMTFQAEV